MNFFIPFIYFVFNAATYVMFTKKSFGKCLPLTMINSAIIMFLSQTLFKTFNVGFYANLIISLIWIIPFIINKNMRKNFISNFFTYGLLAFFILYTYIGFLHLKSVITKYDEYYHWGVMVKEMLKLDKFYTIPASHLMVHKDYPPMIQIFELFYIKLMGRFSEAYLFRSLKLFMLSMIVVPIVEKLEFKNVKQIILNVISLIGISLLLILMFDGHAIINTIYIDYFLSIICAYGFWLVISNEEKYSLFNIFSLSTTLSFMLLTKQMGLPLYLMILFLFCLDFLFKLLNDKFKYKDILKSIKNKIVIKRLLLTVLLLIVVPLSFYVGWSKYISYLKLDQQFKFSDIKISELYRIVKKTGGETYQQEASTNYLIALQNKNIVSSSPIALSYNQSIIMIILLMFVIWYFYNKYFYKKQLFAINLTLILGALGYAFTMWILYVFSFREEGPILASFNRYMPTYILICLFSLLYVVSLVISKNKNKYFIPILFGILIIIQTPSQLSNFIPSLRSADENIYQYHAKKILKTTKNNSKVYIISQTKNQIYTYYIKYYSDGRITNALNYTLPVDIDNTEEYFTKNIESYMKEFDYLYLANCDKNFIKKYGFLFDNENIKKGQTYKIEAKNDNIKLVLVEV